MLIDSKTWMLTIAVVVVIQQCLLVAAKEVDVEPVADNVRSHQSKLDVKETMVLNGGLQHNLIYYLFLLFCLQNLNYKLLS